MSQTWMPVMIPMTAPGKGTSGSVREVCRCGADGDCPIRPAKSEGCSSTTRAGDQRDRLQLAEPSCQGRASGHRSSPSGSFAPDE